MSLEDQVTTFNESLTLSQLQSAPLQYLLAPVLDDSEVDSVVHKANGGESVATAIEKNVLETQMISQSLHCLAGARLEVPKFKFDQPQDRAPAGPAAGESRNGPRDSEGT
jgi:hypothetical protein